MTIVVGGFLDAFTLTGGLAPGTSTGASTVIVDGLLTPFSLTGGLGGSGVFPIGPIFDGLDVCAALEAWWLATPGMVALVSDGKLWHRQAPEDVPLPYATYFLVSDTPEIWTTGYAWERASIQVNFHAHRAADARALAKAFRLAIKGAPLAIDGSPVCHVLPDGAGLEIGEGLGPRGHDCWVATQVLDIPFTQ